MLRYIPPALRNQGIGNSSTNSASTPTIPRTLESLSSQTQRESNRENRIHYDDIHEHFWPLDGNDENHTPAMSFYQRATLNNSAKSPDKLDYVLLFPEAHPRWDNDRIIFVKSHLELLPDDPNLAEASKGAVSTPDNTAATSSSNGAVESAEVGISFLNLESREEKHYPAAETSVEPSIKSSVEQKDSHFSHIENTNPSLNPGESIKDSPISEKAPKEPLNPNPSIPSAPLPTGIAVFEQKARMTDNRYSFVGWFKIKDLERLAPHSQRLIDMLEQKWQGKKRNPVLWNESLGYEWAVVRFEEDEGAKRENGELKIVPGKGYRERDRGVRQRSGGSAEDDGVREWGSARFGAGADKRGDRGSGAQGRSWRPGNSE
ncbi:hypothetical protein M501DRAFT_850147 [Patellaria atrata CBS 101060]|uniref:Uncharacterized protein n=1 Tax=Patellaria atrata CBS 101060 TaxID=1346257 RepID=A0A9P4S8H7_9PEZI|nr:hypothetical protein M501DRAFT_850147 [Patellaria atrata CBS 101060]